MVSLGCTDIEIRKFESVAKNSFSLYIHCTYNVDFMHMIEVLKSQQKSRIFV